MCTDCVTIQSNQQLNQPNNMSKMSEMHSIVATLSEKYGFDLDEALRAVDDSMADPPAKTKLVAMLDGQKVKRAQSAYIFYTNDARPQFKEQYPDKKVTELAKLMGAAWKQLSEEEKAPFEAKAEADKARHADEMSRAEMVPEKKKKTRGAKAKVALGGESPAAPPAPTLALAAEDEAKEAPAHPAETAKRGPKAKIPLPFCGETMEGKCEAIRKNHGLYTQCQMDRVGGETLCKTCLKKQGALPYGVVANRETTLASLGVVPTRYCEVIEKMGISRAQAESAASELGWTIPDVEFEAAPQKGRKRRGKKKQASTAVDSTDDEAETKAPKAKADNRVVTTAKDGDDLITSLIQNAEREAAGGAGEELEEEEPLEVMVFEHDGVQYLRSKENVLFDQETEEEIGRWDEEQQQIVKA